jgi:hypothetical protein
MMPETQGTSPWVSIIAGVPWSDIFASIWSYLKRLYNIISPQGMYEVLEYDSILELKDTQGKKAVFKKREKVRYLQDNIIAYQDQAWGDGEILLDYQCSPGKPVDFYRPGRKTYVVISLQGVRQRDDMDEFHIQWVVKNGFLRAQELWESEVSHPTRRMKVQVIFPKARHPMQVTASEDIRRKSYLLDSDNQRRLPDGRWLVSWERKNPRLNERYIIKWEW